MDNPSQYMVHQVQNYFLQSTIHQRDATSLIKVHNTKLSQIGDITFPLNSDTWENYFKINLCCEGGKFFNTNSSSAEESKERFLEYARNWIFPIKEVKLVKDRCALVLNRKVVTELLLNKILVLGNYCHARKDPNKLVRIVGHTSSSPTVSEHRAKLVKRTLKKLLALSDWTEVSDGCEKTVGVVSISTNVAFDYGEKPAVVIKCGTVLDPNDGKLAKISPEDYVRLRSTDMRLMAMHKYGIRVKDDQKFFERFEKLGEAAVTVDLLEVKHSSPVHIIRSSQGCTKGASFILYNSARLETLLRSFDERVENGTYAELPPLADIDVGLLSTEDEWELVYGYIFAFPNLVQRCIENVHAGSCGVHYLIKYLDGLVSSFSVYYRRTRILTETRPHLMPSVYARIYLLKAIRSIFNMTLSLLDIEPVQFM